MCASPSERFVYGSLEQLASSLGNLGLDLPLEQSIDSIFEPLHIGRKPIPNRIVAQPMEGADATAKGKPDELTYRRYERVASGGAGLIWYEATAVVPEGKGNPRQLLLSEENTKSMKDLLERTVNRSVENNGPDRKPYTVIQLTHSGRYCRPNREPKPIIAASNPYLDGQVPGYARLISDDELAELEDRFAAAALMAGESGFDAVDIKACHGYLISELLSAHTREGRYGGPFENRTRFLVNVIDEIQNRTKGALTVTVRLNAYDAVPYPYGWGVDKEDSQKYDLSEPLELARILSQMGVRIVNITAGVPYLTPHISRPYDAAKGMPPDPPLAGVARLLRLSQAVQEASPRLYVVATGLSWLGEFGLHIASGGLHKGWYSLAGFGRQMLAYPDFPQDVLNVGKMERKKCCITCGKCSEMLRSIGKAGCVVRDAEVYLPIYRKIGRSPA